MIINIKALIYIYSSVILLLLINILKDRFEPRKKVFDSHHWPLTPGIVILSLFSSSVVIESCWNYIPILKNYEYSPFNWEVAIFLIFCSILFLEYILLRYIYKASIVKVFDLKMSRFPFILKVCGVLALINIFSVIFLDLDLILKPQELDLAVVETMDNKNFLLFCLNTIIFLPIVEEGMFRGLIYTPLYRKLGRCTAIVLSSLIWAHGHFYPLLASIGIFINGLILVWLYDRSGSLVHPLIFHMFTNSWIVVHWLRWGLPLK